MVGGRVASMPFDRPAGVDRPPPRKEGCGRPAPMRDLRVSVCHWLDRGRGRSRSSGCLPAWVLPPPLAVGGQPERSVGGVDYWLALEGLIDKLVGVFVHLAGNPGKL